MIRVLKYLILKLTILKNDNFYSMDLFRFISWSIG
jgi:hypothetical protein